MSRVAICGLALALAACVKEVPAADKGEDMFNDPGLSASNLNEVSCATCHATTAEEPAGRRLSGYTMWGVTTRTRYWGGQEVTLVDAIDQCLVYFMRGQPLDTTSLESRALHEYLRTLGPDVAAEEKPYTIVERIEGVPDGDATRGATVWAEACQECHGEIHTGNGRLPGRDLEEIVFPEYATTEYPSLFPDDPPGLVVVEKVRHGGYFNTAGVMPPFSTERLSDEQLGDVLAYLGLTSLSPE